MENQQVALVTGTSSGFGLLTSIALAKAGYLVIATMRDLNRSGQLMTMAKELGVYEKIQVHQLDVTSEDSIHQIKNLVNSIGQIDVLVNNAGYAGAGFVEEIPITEYRKQFETNVFGVISVTQAILPIMRTRGRGKIINVSSISGRISFPGLSPYTSSKHALEGWSESLRIELKAFGIDVVLVEPGSYQTNIWTSGKKVTEKSRSTKSPYFQTMVKIEDHLNKNMKNYGDPNEVANLIVTIARKNKTKLRYPVGKSVGVTMFLKNLLPWSVWEKLVLKQLK
ncbi:oxidoreductase [Litchfieldia salsa]|uniref:NADP-dependent 3-hydroxy acid dehydrogenase YdfG n=1 Tax=Litchfieldia salsa TaxID=930152 RepID=A0A1H0UAA0_9BACI|nr:oxidoreductase [Litchfieldia salsa]SDP63061.1 NADP-dependent 3-hydroxy acid dehydrogenase YdfG [Litchfieldia salsa]